VLARRAAGPEVDPARARRTPATATIDPRISTYEAQVIPPVSHLLIDSHRLYVNRLEGIVPTS
jgi:hypothetical protein